ncbi:RNA polymerase II transcriptional coactivator KELP [Senna tora]|uniref:RNA polymerase II transcriptional coactivator KELP n=1 Tax=Senna tora TaxID=362788 RepID=A0A834XGZ8_9FABA|nr:RNA polymerase II transcriptional coactivator KELP [Senna tora]
MVHLGLRVSKPFPSSRTRKRPPSLAFFPSSNTPKCSSFLVCFYVLAPLFSLFLVPTSFSQAEAAVPGISLPTEQWSSFKKSVPAIEEAIAKMEAKMRCEVHGKQNGDVLNPVLDAAPSEPVPIEIGRFDGKNYHTWVQLMESLLKQLKIAYVLTELCPNSTPGSDANAEDIAEAMAAEKRWMNDDFMCRRNILCYLSDHLFNQYANRKMTAKELWEELKFVYLYEEFGTKRSQVKRYIEFQMVDENPLLEQVHEFNTIADSVVSAGTFFDENFHVSVIISKLPPSWKDVRIKLMREEYLPFWMLMERLRTEEESRNQFKGMGDHFNHNLAFNEAKKFGSSGADIKHSSMYGQRNKQEMNGKIIVCQVCGKKGHLSRNCWRKTDRQARERRVEENGPTTPAVAEVNMVGVENYLWSFSARGCFIAHICTRGLNILLLAAGQQD